MSEMRCPKCGALSPEQALYCQMCGHALVCRNCQAPILSTAQACIRCGLPVTERSNKAMQLTPIPPTGYNQLRVHETPEVFDANFIFANEVAEHVRDFLPLLFGDRLSRQDRNGTRRLIEQTDVHTIVSKEASSDTNQHANGHFSNRDSLARMRAAHVRLVPLEQAQRLDADGYQAEVTGVAEALKPVLPPAAKPADTMQPLELVSPPLAKSVDVMKPLEPVTSPSAKHVDSTKPLASATNRTRQVITVVVACLGMFMVFLDSTIVNVALPTIQTNLNAGLSDLQWVVDAYTLPLAVLTLTAGTLGDRFGRKRLFLIGLTLFLVGSTLCGFASTLGWFFFGRVVQGVGAAALSPGSLSVLVATFPNPRERAQAIGIWAGASGIGLAAGPLAGGLLIQIASWPAIFFVNLPVGLVALVLGWQFLAESRNPGARKLDLPGQLAMIGALTCLTVALIESSSQGWTSPLIISLFVGSGVCLLVFLLVEAQAHEPMLPLGLFGNRVFSVANIASLVSSFAFTGTIFFIAQYFQEVLGYTALQSGLHTLPITLGIFLIGPVAGQLAARLGPRLPIVLGALLLSSGLFLLMRLTTADDYAALWWNLGMLGVGYGLMISPMTVAVVSTTPPNRAGLASSVTGTSRQIGVTLGTAVLGAFVTQQFASNITSQLTQLGIPSLLSATIAGKIASTGAQASRLQLPRRHLPPPAILHQAINQAFVSALNQSFIISGTAIAAIVLLVAFFLYQKRRSTHMGVKSVDWQATTSGNPIQYPAAVRAEDSARSRSLGTTPDYVGSASR